MAPRVCLGMVLVVVGRAETLKLKANVRLQSTGGRLMVTRELQLVNS